MKLNTVKFGNIEIKDEKVINFRDGILGFAHLKRFTIIRNEEASPFFWLQAIDDGSVSLSCMNPFDIDPSYSPVVSEALLADLNTEDDSDLLIITTVTVRKDVLKATTNMAAPIIINTVNNKGIQAVLQDYNVRQPVFSEKEDSQNADTFQKD